MPVSENGYTKQYPLKTKKKKPKRPHTVLKHFFGNLQLPDRGPAMDELYTAFLTLDLYQLSDKERNYIRHLFNQLIKLIEATHIMHIALRRRERAKQPKNDSQRVKLSSQ